MSFFFFQAEDGIRYLTVTGVQTCALPIAVHRDAGAALSSVADELAQALGRRDAHDQRGDRAEPPATARVPIHRARPTQVRRGRASWSRRRGESMKAATARHE